MIFHPLQNKFVGAEYNSIGGGGKKLRLPHWNFQLAIGRFVDTFLVFILYAYRSIYISKAVTKRIISKTITKHIQVQNN